MPKLPSRMLADLEEQHAAIRKLMDVCEGLDGPALYDAVDDLRVALDAHNRYEERLLLPVLPSLDAFGDIRVDQMIHDHINEHLAMNEQLQTTTREGILHAFELVRSHMASEERYFITSRVLRDDLVTLEGAG